MYLSKGEEATRYILEKVDNISKTKLIKLLFLADRSFLKTNKADLSITGFRYVRYFYGPYSVEIEDVVGSLSIKGLIEYRKHITPKDEVYLISKTDKKVKFEHLKEEEKKTLAKIAEEFGSKSLPEILDKIYDLDEVKRAEFGDEITFSI